MRLIGIAAHVTITYTAGMTILRKQLDDLLTVAEIADELDLKPSSVRQYVFRRILIPTRLSRSLFFARSEVARFKKARLRQGQHSKTKPKKQGDS